jgi:biopolymer transport protein ExbD
MPVMQPSRVLLRGVPLEFVSRRVSGDAKKPVDVTLALVPIIDLMICLVVFLLMSFSSSGELIEQKAGITMPKAVHAEELAAAPQLTVDASVVALDGRRMADTPSLAGNPALERIEPLVADLERLHHAWLVLHPNQEFPGALVLQADVSIDYRVIKKLMFNAGLAGYHKVSFAVTKIEAR